MVTRPQEVMASFGMPLPAHLTTAGKRNTIVLRMSTTPTPRTRSVRLDAEAERALAAIQRLTGDSISDALKRGLLAAERELRNAPVTRAYAVYERLELGAGGYAKGPSDRVTETIREHLRRKNGR